LSGVFKCLKDSHDIAKKHLSNHIDTQKATDYILNVRNEEKELFPNEEFSEKPDKTNERGNGLKKIRETEKSLGLKLEK